jgi:hypothetical protein
MRFLAPLYFIRGPATANIEDGYLELSCLRDDTFYGKMFANMDKDRNLAKEPWDSSTEKAKTLKIGDFGVPERVEEMAKPVRFAGDRGTAVGILKNESIYMPRLSMMAR